MKTYALVSGNRTSSQSVFVLFSRTPHLLRSQTAYNAANRLVTALSGTQKIAYTIDENGNTIQVCGRSD